MRQLLSFLLLLTVPVFGQQTFRIVNPYKGTDGTGPYANWYGFVSHTHGPDTGSSGTLSQLFTDSVPGGGGDAVALKITVVPINDKDKVSPDPGGHPGQYYMPGYEEVWGDPHIVCIGCTTWTARTSIQDALDKIFAQGGIGIIAHPNFDGFTGATLATLTHVDGIEVSNGQGFNGWNEWDSGLAAGRKLLGVAGNDLYSAGYKEVNYVNSPTGHLEDILANFKLGNFYGTDMNTGLPDGALRVTQTGNTLTASFYFGESNLTPRGMTVTWYCGYPIAQSVCGTGASYTVQGNEKYVRPMIGTNLTWAHDRTWGQAIYVVPVTMFPLPSTVSHSGV
jgi:hypothetical protein